MDTPSTLLDEIKSSNLELNREFLYAESSDEDMSYSDEDDHDTVRNLQRELKIVEDERDELQNFVVCKICLVNRSDTLFLSCRHLSTCYECADRVTNGNY